MRVVIAHARDADGAQLRQSMLGAGLECNAGDCVPYEGLSARLASGSTDVVIVDIGREVRPALEALAEARSLTMVPVMAIGPSGDSEVVELAKNSGAERYLDNADLRGELDAAVESLAESGAAARRRGTIVSVFAPQSGSGGTTVACYLAGAMANIHPDGVALIEVQRSSGDVSLLLEVDARHSAREVCRRWTRLDATSLGNSFSKHPSAGNQIGLRVLANGEDQAGNEFVCRDAVRRIAVLTRSLFHLTVLALESRIDDESVEAMLLSDIVLLVVRPDVPSLRRTQWAMSMLASRGVPRDRFRLVVNRWGQSGQLPLRQIEDNLGLNAFQLIPDDTSRVNKATNRGVLLQEISRRASISRKFAKLASALNGQVSRNGV